MSGLYAVAREDFEFAKLPCVWTMCCGVLGLGFFRVPLCVCTVLWCVRTWSFQSSPVCMPCAVVREDFEFP